MPVYIEQDFISDPVQQFDFCASVFKIYFVGHIRDLRFTFGEAEMSTIKINNNANIYDLGLQT